MWQDLREILCTPSVSLSTQQGYYYNNTLKCFKEIIGATTLLSCRFQPYYFEDVLMCLVKKLGLHVLLIYLYQILSTWWSAHGVCDLDRIGL